MRLGLERDVLSGGDTTRLITVHREGIFERNIDHGGEKERVGVGGVEVVLM
jgi:hypothetical protein